jgi:malate permease and related proteins
MNFLLIAICLLSGFFLRTFKILADDAYKGINVWILYVAFPAVALHYIPAVQWKFELLLPLIMPLIVWSGAWLMLKIISPSFKLEANACGALLLTAGVGNTSFVGFPLTQAYWGNEGLRIAVICDQLSFIVLSTLGIISAMHGAHSGNTDARKIIAGLLRFPPFISFIAALLLPHIISLSAFDSLLQTLGGTLVPLALFSVGTQIQVSEWKSKIKYLFLGLSYKLLIAPAIIFGIAILAGVKGVVAQASIFEAAMAPSITAAIVSSQYSLDPKLSSLMASIGMMVSFLTTVGWWIVLVPSF